MRIDFNGLEAFLSIATWGSFKRAASRLALSQAALSHRLKKLEDNLGVQLLTRTSREVTLTPAGLDLLPVAQSVFRDASSKLDSIRIRGRARSERVAFGCLPTVSLLYLPEIFAEFRRRMPQTVVQVYDNSTEEIAERVRSGTAEFGVTIVSIESWDLEVMPLMEEPFVLVCQTTHPFAQRPSVRWSELQSEPLIRISAEAGNRVLIDEALGSRGETMNWCYEVQRVATALNLVREGVGLTVLPAIGLGSGGHPDFVAVPLHDPSVTRTLGILKRRGDPLTPGAATLLKLIAGRLTRAAADAMPSPVSPASASAPSIKSNRKTPRKPRQTRALKA